MVSLVKVYASQTFTNAADLTGDGDLMEAVRVYMETAKARRLRGAIPSSAAQPELLYIQTVHDHAVPYFCAVHID